VATPRYSAVISRILSWALAICLIAQTSTARAGEGKKKHLGLAIAAAAVTAIAAPILAAKARKAEDRYLDRVYDEKRPVLGSGSKVSDIVAREVFRRKDARDAAVPEVSDAEFHAGMTEYGKRWNVQTQLAEIQKRAGTTKGPVRVFVLSDSGAPYERDDPSTLRKHLAYIAAEGRKAAKEGGFVVAVHLGDFGESGTRKEVFQYFKTLTEAADRGEAPPYFIQLDGNHDRPEKVLESYLPTHHGPYLGKPEGALHFRGQSLVFLDTSTGTLASGGPEGEGAAQVAARQRIAANRLRWLDGELSKTEAPDGSIIRERRVLTHFPLGHMTTVTGSMLPELTPISGYFNEDRGSKKLEDMLARRGASIYSGHVHLLTVAEQKSGVRQTVVGGAGSERLVSAGPSESVAHVLELRLEPDGTSQEIVHIQGKDGYEVRPIVDTAPKAKDGVFRAPAPGMLEDLPGGRPHVPGQIPRLVRVSGPQYVPMVTRAFTAAARDGIASMRTKMANRLADLRPARFGGARAPGAPAPGLALATAHAPH
jgi:hypothetical protein